MMRTLPSCALMLMLAAPLFAQQPPAENLRTISTSGDAIVYVTPDEVIVNLGVETFSRSLDESQATNTKSCAKLLEAVKGVGVEDRNIQTDVMQFEVTYTPGARGNIEGYFCRRGYQVTLKDPKLFEKLVATALQNGTNRLMGFEFRTSELRKYRDEARQMAIKAAKEKATALAGELGAHVGKPRSITENGTGSSGYVSGWSGRSSSIMGQNSFVDRSSGSGDVGETTRLGQIAISARVSVAFDLTVE